MGKVNLSQAQGATFSTGDFRRMVNYENTTNRGYVRMRLEDGGKVGLQKVSKHFYSVPFHSLRSNVTAEYNREVRRALVAALSVDLRYVDDATVRHLKDRIIHVSDATGKVAVNETSLSRRELRDVFVRFDAQFNTPAGRRDMLCNLVKAFSDRCGFGRDIAPMTAITEKFGISAEELDGMFAAGEGPDVQGHKPMARDEMAFRHFLRKVETCADQYAVRHACDNAGIVMAQNAFINAKAVNAFDLNGEDSVRLKGALMTDLSMAGFFDVNDGEPRGAQLLDVFAKKIVPAAFRQAVADAKAFGLQPGTEAFSALVNESCGYDKLFDLAKTFFAKAKTMMADKNWNVAFCGAYARKNSGLFQLAQNGLINKAALKMVEEADVKSGEAKKLADEIGKNVVAYEKDVCIDVFAEKFAEEAFGPSDGTGTTDDSVLDDKGEFGLAAPMLKKMLQDADHVVTALKIENGGRHKVSDGKEVRYQNEDHGAKDFVEQFCSMIDPLIRKHGTSKAVVNGLFTKTMPNLLNQRIELVNDGFRKTLRLDDKAYGAFATAMFQAEKDASAFEKASRKKIDSCMKSAERMLRTLVKRGKIDEAEKGSILADYRAKLESARDRALDRFFLQGPFDAEGERKSSGRTALDNSFAGFLDEALSDFNNVLTAQSYRAKGVAALKLLRVDKNVDAAFSAHLANKGVDLAPVVDGVKLLDADEVAVILKKGPLTRAWNKALADNPPPNGKDVDAKHVERVNKDFNVALASIMATALDFQTNLVHGLRKELEDGINTLLGDPKGVLGEYCGLPAADKKAFAGKLVGDVLLSFQGQMANVARDFLAHPKAYGKKELSDLIAHAFHGEGARGTFGRTLQIVDKRIVKGEKQFTEALEKSTSVALADHYRKRVTEHRLPEVVVNRFVETETARVFARAKTMPAFYAELSATEMFERMQAECKAAVDARIKAFLPHKTAFDEAIQKANADFGSLQGEVNAVYDHCMASLARQPEFPPLDEAVSYYRNLLGNKLDTVQGAKVKEFETYRAEVVKAHANIDAMVREILGEAAKKVAGDGASAETQKLFAKYSDMYFNLLSTDVSADPAKFLGEEGLSDARYYCEKFTERLVAAYEARKPDDALCDALVAQAGFGKLAANVDFKAQFRAEFATFMKSAVGVAAHDKFVAAAFDNCWRRYSTGETEELKNALKTAEAAFADDVKKTVFDGVAAQMDVARFMFKDVAKAEAAYRHHISLYDLPSVPDADGKTIEDRLVDMFYQRVHDLSVRAANGESVDGEVIFNATLDDDTGLANRFAELIGTRGVNDRIDAVLSETASEEVEALVHMSKHSALLDENAPNLSFAQKSAAKLNLAHLKDTIAASFNASASTARSSSYSDLRYGEILGDVLVQAHRDVADKINTALVEAGLRMRCVDELVGVLDKMRADFGALVLSKILPAKILKEYAGGLDGVVPFLLQHGVPEDLLADMTHLVGQAKSALELRLADLTDVCMEKPAVGKALEDVCARRFADFEKDLLKNGMPDYGQLFMELNKGIGKAFK